MAESLRGARHVCEEATWEDPAPADAVGAETNGLSPSHVLVPQNCEPNKNCCFTPLAEITSHKLLKQLTPRSVRLLKFFN